MLLNYKKNLNNRRQPKNTRGHECNNNNDQVDNFR